MKLYEFITGQGGIMTLGLIALSVLFYRKWKTQRYFKHIEKKEKERKTK